MGQETEMRVIHFIEITVLVLIVVGCVWGLIRIEKRERKAKKEIKEGKGNGK